MPSISILLAVLFQVSLTLLLYILLGIAKNKATKLGEVDEHRRNLHADAWPEYVQKLNNAVANQFEAPVLFYVLVFVLLSMGNIAVYVEVLCWLFVITRFMHAFIHTGSNYVPRRKISFVAGVYILLVLTIICFIQLLLLL